MGEGLICDECATPEEIEALSHRQMVINPPDTTRHTRQPQAKEKSAAMLAALLLVVHLERLGPSGRTLALPCRGTALGCGMDTLAPNMAGPSLEVNKQLVLRFYDELWNRGNFDAADELVADHYVRHDLRRGDAPPGPAGQKAVAQRFRAAFPDVRLEVEALVAEGDLVVARWTISGTHSGAWGDVAATGRNVRFTGVNFFRLADGKIAEIWNVRDDLGLREQLGAPVYAGYPADSEG